MLKKSAKRYLPGACGLSSMAFSTSAPPIAVRFGQECPARPCSDRESFRSRSPVLPTHPGEMLLREFLEPLGVSQVEAARRMNIPFQRLTAIVRGVVASVRIRRCCSKR
jgi:hypothetical protein